MPNKDVREWADETLQSLSQGHTVWFGPHVWIRPYIACGRGFFEYGTHNDREGHHAYAIAPATLEGLINNHDLIVRLAANQSFVA